MVETVRRIDISDAEQLPVPSWRRNDDQQSSIKQFTGIDVYKSGISHSFLHWSHSFSLKFLIFCGWGLRGSLKELGISMCTCCVYIDRRRGEEEGDGVPVHHYSGEWGTLLPPWKQPGYGNLWSHVFLVFSLFFHFWVRQCKPNEQKAG